MRKVCETKIEKTLVIQAPVEKVFAFMAEPHNLLEIWPSLLEVRNVEPLPNGGYCYDWAYKMAGLRYEVRAVQYILASYPVSVDGALVQVRPHDCRRTYARRLYEAGVDPVAIKQNLGHAQLTTTLHYIGTLDAQQRRAPAIYSFDLAELAKAPIQQRLD